MRNFIKYNLKTFIALSGISIILYMIHFFIFGDAKETLSVVLLTLAYSPVGIFYDIVILNKILEQREKAKMTNRTNIIIGSFYHEIGNDLIKVISKGDNTIKTLRDINKIDKNWKVENFIKLREAVLNYKCDINIKNIDLIKLKNLLSQKEEFILNLIMNNTLAEYEEFNNMLLETLHLRDEMELRNFELSDQCLNLGHLNVDICRTYIELITQWVNYMKHLKIVYPSLFIKALIESPFNMKSKEDINKEYEKIIGSEEC